MTVYQSSFLDGENEEEHAIGFQRILNSMVDPVIEMCSTVGTERKAAKQRWDQEVFVLNCLTYLQVRMVESVWTFGISLTSPLCRVSWSPLHLQPKSRVRFRRLSMSESGHLRTNTYVTVSSLKFACS
jgi:hypothetical protein